MYYIRQHIRDIIATYDGTFPLTHFLKRHFKAHPKLGSRDRKILSEMAYAWYRITPAVLPETTPFEELLQVSLLLSDSELPHILKMLPDEWAQQKQHTLQQRISWLQDKGISFDAERLCPALVTLSEGISRGEWLQSMLHRPDVFIAVPAKYRSTVKQRLQEEGLSFKQMDGNCLALPPGTAADKILEPHMYRVQDASSQQTAEYFRVSGKESCWDCCSGAGGKSLLLKEIQPQVQLTVSDVRASILQNLTERFRMYGYTLPEQLQLSAADEQQTKQLLGQRRFDQIICDVPCTGSGTWARTPEQLHFFDAASIKDFAARQKSIAANVRHYLKPGAAMIYITCSVFAAENEEVVAYLLALGGLELQEQQLINGTGNAADSMFVAVMRKSR